MWANMIHKRNVGVAIVHPSGLHSLTSGYEAEEKDAPFKDILGHLNVFVWFPECMPGL